MSENNFKEKQWENKSPIQHAIYKGVTGKLGALRLSLKEPYSDTRREKPHGCVFLDLAPAIDKNIYDWNNQKIVMALGITDLGKIVSYLRAPNHNIFKGTLNLYHDKGAGTADKNKHVTTVTINKVAGKDNFFLSASQKENGAVIKQATVTISPDEAVVIGTLLQTAISRILSWS